MTAGDYKGDGKLLSISPKTTTSAGLVAGDLCTLTGDYTGTSVTGDFSATEVIGVVVTGSLDANVLGTVGSEGIFELTAGSGNVTAGKTVVANAYNEVEDGTTAGQVIGRALETATAGNTADILIRV